MTAPLSPALEAAIMEVASAAFDCGEWTRDDDVSYREVELVSTLAKEKLRALILADREAAVAEARRNGMLSAANLVEARAARVSSGEPPEYAHARAIRLLAAFPAPEREPGKGETQEPAPVPPGETNRSEP